MFKTTRDFWNLWHMDSGFGLKMWMTLEAPTLLHRSSRDISVAASKRQDDPSGIHSNFFTNTPPLPNKRIPASPQQNPMVWPNSSTCLPLPIYLSTVSFVVSRRAWMVFEWPPWNLTPWPTAWPSLRHGWGGEFSGGEWDGVETRLRVCFIFFKVVCDCFNILLIVEEVDCKPFWTCSQGTGDSWTQSPLS